MAKRQEWTVRVVNYHFGSGVNHLSDVWVDQLRYMGIARELAAFEQPVRSVIEFYAPKGTDSKVWADQNAARMRSFGIDAAAAPKWAADNFELGSKDGPTNMQTHMERLNRPKP